MDRFNDARKTHQTMDLIGLRAQATAVGLVQLCAELVRSGVLDSDGLDRIKEAIANDILATRGVKHDAQEFERSLRGRLDMLFSGRASARATPVRIGTVADLPPELAGNRTEE